MADWPTIPAGYGYPLVDMDTFRLPDATMDAIAESPELAGTIVAVGDQRYASQLVSTEATATATVNTWIATPSALGVKRLVGVFAPTAPIALPSDTYLDVTGARILRDHAGAGNSGATFVNSDQVGGNENITVVGAHIDVLDAAADGKHFGFVNVTNLRIANTTIDGCVGDFMALFKNCHKVTVHDAIWKGSLGHGEDGLHIYGGSSYAISDVHIESGDDAISITTEIVDNVPVTDVHVTNATLRSVFASEIKIHAKTHTISGLHFTNVSIDHPVGNTTSAIRLIDEFSDLSDAGCWDVQMSQFTMRMNLAAAYAIRGQGIDSLVLNDFEVRGLNQVGLYLSGGPGATTPIMKDFRGTGLRFYDQNRAGTFTMHLDHLNRFELAEFLVLGSTAHAVVIGGAAACTEGLVRDGVVMGGLQSGIRLTNSSTYIRVRGNRVGGAQAQAITESSGADNNTIELNDTRGATSSAITKSGANTVVRRNQGYRTENQGTGTIADGSSSVVIAAHGISTTPTVATATAKGTTPTALSVVIGAGSLTVYRTGTTGALDFSWTAVA